MDMIPVANVAALQKVMYVTSADWQEVKYGTTPAPSRKWVQLENKSPYTIYYSYDDSVNVGGAFSVAAGGILVLPLSDAVPVYIKGITTGSSNNQRVVIAEVA